jgi:hypothetical protein
MNDINGTILNDNAIKYRQGLYAGPVMPLGINQYLTSSNTGYTLETNKNGNLILSGTDIISKSDNFKQALANTYTHIISANSLSSYTLYDGNNKAIETNVSYMIPVNKPKNNDNITSADIMSVNSNNFKFMSLLKNYFNLTYNATDYLSDEQTVIKNFASSGIVYSILPKITKLKLDSKYTFVYKYCNNCYYLNNSVYTNTETNIPPSTVISGQTIN